MSKITVSPGRVIVFSMLALIVVGTLLLMLPFAQKTPIPFFDCLFAATSALCVTGTLTVPLAEFSAGGHIILLFLIQIGALGLITLSVSFLSLFSTLRLSTKSVTGEALELTVGQHPGRLAVFTIVFTMIIEGLGAVASWMILRQHMAPLKAALLSCLHSVDSFCNAGFGFLTPRTVAAYGTFGYCTYLTITGTLILLGGLGFIVWYEVVAHLQDREYYRRKNLSLHTRVVLTATLYLIAAAAVLLLFLEYIPLLKSHFSGVWFLESLFNAISLRSAGITTFNERLLQPATLLIIMLLSFIGSSPGSTGSGIKTTTCALFLAAIKATLLRKTSVHMRGRTIPNDLVFKAMAIVALSLAWIATITFLLLLTEHTTTQPFELLFQAISSFTNLGLSPTIPAHFSSFGKITLIIAMISGRIGSLTILLALKKRTRHAPEIQYPEERIMLG